MATYIQARSLFNDSDLQNKCETAVVVAAYALLNKAGATVDEKELALKVFNATAKYAQHAKLAYIAANKGKTLTQLKATTDADVQAFVDVVAPALVGA